MDEWRDRRFTPREAAAIRAEYAKGKLGHRSLMAKYACAKQTIQSVLQRVGCYSPEREAAWMRERETDG